MQLSKWILCRHIRPMTNTLRTTFSYCFHIATYFTAGAPTHGTHQSLSRTTAIGLTILLDKHWFASFSSRKDCITKRTHTILCTISRRIGETRDETTKRRRRKKLENDQNDLKRKLKKKKKSPKHENMNSWNMAFTYLHSSKTIFETFSHTRRLHIRFAMMQFAFIPKIF